MEFLTVIMFGNDDDNPTLHGRFNRKEMIEYVSEWIQNHPEQDPKRIYYYNQSYYARENKCAYQFVSNYSDTVNEALRLRKEKIRIARNKKIMEEVEKAVTAIVKSHNLTADYTFELKIND